MDLEYQAMVGIRLYNEQMTAHIKSGGERKAFVFQ